VTADDLDAAEAMLAAAKEGAEGADGAAGAGGAEGAEGEEEGAEVEDSDAENDADKEMKLAHSRTLTTGKFISTRNAR